jgi:PKD repeat protein
MGNGDIRYGETISYTYDSAYEYFITLTVYDRSYLSGSAHTIVTVIQPNRAPETPLISGLTDLFTSAEYSFLAHSDDADNDDIEYIFDWDDGTESTSGPLSLPGGQAYNALHAWDEPGDYTITVTVSDGDLSSSEDFEITVTQPVQTTNIAIVLLAIILIAALLIVYFARKNNE